LPHCLTDGSGSAACDAGAGLGVGLVLFADGGK
jgi:hypothetical protein